MKRRSVLSSLAAAGLAAPTLLRPRAARAEIRQRTLRFAHQNQADHPQGQGVRKFADIVQERSGGKISVRAFPGGTLGGDLQTVSALQGGTLDLTVLNSGLLVGLVKEFGLLDLPFLFNSPREADAVVDGPFGQRLHGLLPDKGLIGLGYWELGFRNLTNSRRPVAKIEDIQGLKIRVLQSPLYIDMWNALGANAVPMPFPEVYTALEQKTVDGQENPVSVILNAKLNEVQRHLTLTRHIYNPQSVIMSKRVWDRLNEEERKLVQDGVKEATAHQRQVSRDSEAQMIDTLKRSMQVVDLAPAETARMREKVQPVAERFTKDMDVAVVRDLHAQVERARATVG
jgi:TRAP-type transport system periplasmic protein